MHIPRIVTRLSAGAVAVGSIVLFKEWLGGTNYSGAESLEGKTVVVTGSNTGIGRETAIELARRKARVIMACRDLTKCKLARKEIVAETLNKNVVCRECDLSSFESVRRFANDLNKRENSIDILINNAGVMRCPRTLSKDGIELQLATNHMGHFLLTMLLLDKIKASQPSRIVTVSSVAHARGAINFSDLNSEENYDASAAYDQSKLANVMFTLRLAKELEDSGVTCSAVHPGLVNTEIGRHMSLYKSWLALLFLRPFLWLLLKSPRQGAQTTIYAALSPHANKSGAYYSNQCEDTPAESAYDAVAQERLWQTSLKWTRLVS
ncbi:Short-chain dehydrogenase/reductase SDR [Trinorchestia longiramus]|nr:Short-chain dehydrogenase/reductase SDR [Trinorchestia longiramus]